MLSQPKTRWISSALIYGTMGGRSKSVIVLFPEPLGPANTIISGFLIGSFPIATLSYSLAYERFAAIGMFHIDLAALGVKPGNGLV